MKTEAKKRILKMAVLMGVGVVLAVGLVYLVDDVLNGMFLDWFHATFMYTYESFTGDSDVQVYVTEPNWHALKGFIIAIFVTVLLLWIVTTAIVANFQGRKRVEKAITDTSRMIREYMSGEGDAADIFPAEYGEISAQMADIKSNALRSQELLKEEARRKNDLITYLAHDLKTPLTSVIGYLSLLEEVPDMPAAQREKYTGITLDKAQRLEKLINEFFEITRYNLQQIVLEKETVDLYYLLVQMTDEFYPLLCSHGNTVELDADENLMVYGDALKLARVFNNILKNAIAYSYPNTEIKISAKITEREIHISIANRGQTIPRQKLETIFEKFFRLDDARATNTGGAGLGLAIAKEIITLHQGSIYAESQDETTVFSVTLPLR